MTYVHCPEDISQGLQLCGPDKFVHREEPRLRL